MATRPSPAFIFVAACILMHGCLDVTIPFVAAWLKSERFPRVRCYQQSPAKANNLLQRAQLLARTKALLRNATTLEEGRERSYSFNEAFDAFRTIGDGPGIVSEVCALQLQTKALELNNLCMSVEEARSIVDMHDHDKNGALNRAEFFDAFMSLELHHKRACHQTTASSSPPTKKEPEYPITATLSDIPGSVQRKADRKAGATFVMAFWAFVLSASFASSQVLADKICEPRFCAAMEQTYTLQSIDGTERVSFRRA